MKLFAALGPGDIVAAHRRQIRGETVPSETSIIYSGQILEFCRLRGIEVLAISHNDRVDQMTVGALHVENKPIFLAKSRGGLYHISQTLRAGYLLYRAKRFGADFALIASGSSHYFPLVIFWLFRIPVVVDFHNTLWPNGYPQATGLRRVIRKLDGFFFRWISIGAMGVSPECGRQVCTLAAKAVPYFDYRCQFRPNDFQFSHVPDRMFRVAFVGRIERNKGALDVPLIAEYLKGKKIKIEVCGDGPAMDELKRSVEEGKLWETVKIRGRLDRSSLLEVYQRSDAVLIPTRSDFAEGIPMVCGEAILSKLPIVTSRLSNALDVVGPGIKEANPDEPESYAKAIYELANNPTLCKEIRERCIVLSRQFIDRDKGIATALDKLLALSFKEWKPLTSYDVIFDRLF
jgi:glycosyltransferase involved in cell wall biosynthesis